VDDRRSPVFVKEIEMPLSEKHSANEREVHRQAKALYTQKTDWVTFYREILGVNGIVRQMFPSRIELEKFEQTKAYEDIQRMLTKLRRTRVVTARPDETTRVITVRLPKSLHEALMTEAYEHHTSMNKLCISKLIQIIDSGMVPRNH
jgi:predicted HicB family RNase H-like nuclease